jgi:Carboxypeptidase regulatory-like domain
MLKALVRISILVALVVICQGTWALAVTTGALSGYIRAQGGAGLADAKVTVTAPSESSNTTTDTGGHYSFVSLIPDTYTITAVKDGYITLSQPGVTVIAGNTQTVSLVLQPAVKTLGVVTTTAAAALVKPGTTNDVYSVNASSQAKVASLGGGGSLNQAYSAIATTPGAIVPPGGMGWFQTVYIRGGDFDQIGYEFDGIPVLRSYDNYPQTTASTLGQQELQVYTGAPPANSQNQGLAGYINQVIKSGTYPGFSSLNLQMGTPAMYNAYNFEVGGGTPDRNFTYYLGSSVSSSEPRYFDQFQGAGIQQTYGAPFAKLACPHAGDINYAACYATGIGPGGYLLGPPIDAVFPSNVSDRENVVNLHFGIPHKNDSGKDDIQLLYDASYLNNLYFSSASDWGLGTAQFQQAYWGATGSPFNTFPFLSGNSPFGPLGYQYLGQVGAPLAANYQALTRPVIFAYQPTNTTSAFIPFNQRDGTANPNSIVKLQYQKNFGTGAYFRIYGYDDYSEWPQTCPDTFADDVIGYCPGNYYVATWTAGGDAEFGDQINDHNLITVDLSDSAATDYRSNDETMINQFIFNNFAYAVNAHNPQNGVCYTSTGVAVSCYSANALAFGLSQAATGAALPTLPGSCGTGPCEWFVAENGRYGGGNYAQPNFATVSASDQIKASNQFFFNLGLREDRFFYNLSNENCPAEATAAGCARQFWFNSFNSSYCVLPGGGQVPFYNAADDTAAGSPCPTVNGIQTNPSIISIGAQTESFWVFQPRFGATYTAGPDNVFRFSYGRVDQAPNTAYEQYNLLQQDLPIYDATNFWPVGFTSTTHQIYPPTADDLDLSWEHHFAGTEASLKLTPYYRTTNNQIQNFFLNQKTNFVSGLNVGQQTSDGVEFQLAWGNFNENGLSALLAYTYNNSYIKQKELGTGGTVYDTINLAIQQYNSFTSACAHAVPNTSTTSLCGTFGNSNAMPTFGTVANPYYNAPPQGRLDPNANYIPFSTIPGGVEAATGSFEYPQTAALVLNYKVNRWAISPQMQFFKGQPYGDPLSGFGVNPADCPAALAGSVSGDPRYPYGGTGSPYDATQCTGTIAVPDPYTKVFDGLGVFRQPNQFLLHMQLSYQASSRVTFVANVANIIDSCSGGSKEPWTITATNNCGYGLPGYGAPLNYGANIYNPGATFQPVVQFPYQAYLGSAQPMEAYFQMKISL